MERPDPSDHIAAIDNDSSPDEMASVGPESAFCPRCKFTRTCAASKFPSRQGTARCRQRARAGRLRRRGGYRHGKLLDRGNYRLRVVDVLEINRLDQLIDIACGGKLLSLKLRKAFAVTETEEILSLYWSPTYGVFSVKMTFLLRDPDPGRPRPNSRARPSARTPCRFRPFRWSPRCCRSLVEDHAGTAVVAVDEQLSFAGSWGA